MPTPLRHCAAGYGRTPQQTRNEFIVIAMSRAAVLAAFALTLAACSSGTDATTPATSAGPSASEAHQEHDHTFADHLTVTDTWVKAADDGMTAAFGVITNTGGHDVTIVGAHSDATSEIQLHEVVNDTMRQVDGGFVIPAGGTLTLEPGGYHLMFMDVPSPISAGDDITIILELEDGSELTFTAIAKDFSGGNETYDDGMGGMDMGASPSASMSMNG